jgi:hypothetical protein
MRIARCEDPLTDSDRVRGTRQSGLSPAVTQLQARRWPVVQPDRAPWTGERVESTRQTLDATMVWIVRKAFTGPRSLQVLLTAVALGVLVFRAIWPDVKLDAVSLGLLVAAALPWMGGLFESLEFPGGLKIGYRELQHAGALLTQERKSAGSVTAEVPYREVRDLSPELGLIGLRIEIERRIQELSDLLDLDPGQRRSLGARLHLLETAGHLTGPQVSALQEIVAAGNAAAHGAQLPPGAEDFAFDTGPEVLGWLDGLIKSGGRKSTS